MKPLSQRMAEANALLAPYAVPHSEGLGREYLEGEDTTRFPFQRDRDRIIHTQAFRRLKGKTQVFVVGKGDHYRTRLTHTMEVTQISRDMARTLGLNEDLAECIALAHDLGHTPFGHAGEEAMREEMQQHGLTYEHNLQSLRIVTLLEERTRRHLGLNLNREVLEGLLKHRTAFDEEHGEHLPRAPSLEAQIVNLADEIAYIAHDTDDGLRAELLRMDQLLHIPLFAEAEAQAAESGTEVRGTLIHLLVSDAYGETWHRLRTHRISSLADVYAAPPLLACFSEDMHEKLSCMREFLWEHLYNASPVLGHAARGKEIVHILFRRYEAEPLPKVLALQQRTGSGLPEAIKDYIAGMTDQFAEQRYQELQQT